MSGRFSRQAVLNYLSSACELLARPASGLLLCDPCGRSYDRATEKDVTVASAIRWAASRARRFSVPSRRLRQVKP